MFVPRSVKRKTGSSDPPRAVRRKTGGSDPPRSVKRKTGSSDPPRAVKRKTGGSDPPRAVRRKTGGSDPPTSCSHATAVSQSLGEASEGEDVSTMTTLEHHGDSSSTAAINIGSSSIQIGSGDTPSIQIGSGDTSSIQIGSGDTPSVTSIPDSDGHARSGCSAIGDSGTVSSESEDDDPVISYSKHQRWPQPGEPVCVVCGRYGAYIVDQTNSDVCSLECKARSLVSLGRVVDSEGEGGTRWEHEEHPTAAVMTDAQVTALRHEMVIEVRGEGMPKPVTHFDSLPLTDQVRANLTEGGYMTPTPVQMQTIPAVLMGRDVLVCASTGSGKTLSFLLPLVIHLAHSASDPPSPRVLILTPTRELGMQIEEQAKQLMKGVPTMKTALVVGGLPIANQLHRLRSGIQIVIATPARLNDILENHADDIDLSHVQAFVLDEVDCLLHMGFELQVRSVEECLPRQRQNLMFSATIPPRIERMASEMMNQPLFISLGVPGSPCESVSHTVIWLEEAAKKKRLFSFLSDKKLFKPPAVVFVNSKAGTLLLADAINKTCRNLSAVGLHGDMAQERRSGILQGFLEGKYSVVVATGVLARGIDLMQVRQVFVFDMPSSVREFIHQIGRGGRLGSPGWAITFINNENKGVFADLVDILEPLGVQLPSQLSHSPHLALQRERRKRRAANHSQGAKKRDNRSLYNRENLMALIKSTQSRKK